MRRGLQWSEERREERGREKKVVFRPLFSLPPVSLSLSLFLFPSLSLSLSLSHTNARLRLEEEEQERAISLNLRNSSSILLLLFLLRLFFRPLLCHRLPLLLPPRLRLLCCCLWSSVRCRFLSGSAASSLDDGGAPGVGEGCGGERDRGERVLFGLFFLDRNYQNEMRKLGTEEQKKASYTSSSHRLQPRDHGPDAARQQRRDEP